jgi:hypothetical protein
LLFRLPSQQRDYFREHITDDKTLLVGISQMLRRHNYADEFVCPKAKRLRLDRGREMPQAAR